MITAITTAIGMKEVVGSRFINSLPGSFRGGKQFAKQDFLQSWDRIVAHASSRDALVQQFHRWFDGFRTLKLIHHLRDTSHVEEEMFAAIAVLLERLGVDLSLEPSLSPKPNLTQQYDLLERLRNL